MHDATDIHDVIFFDLTRIKMGRNSVVLIAWIVIDTLIDTIILCHAGRSYEEKSRIRGSNNQPNMICIPFYLFCITSTYHKKQRIHILIPFFPCFRITTIFEVIWIMRYLRYALFFYVINMLEQYGIPEHCEPTCPQCSIW